MTSHPQLSLANLSPANFGMAMATGIISVAALHFGFYLLAEILFYLNNFLFFTICILTFLRLCKYPKVFWTDLTSHANGLGFLTFVAATNLLGTQYLLMYHNATAGLIFWVIGVCSWLLITYIVFTALI